MLGVVQGNMKVWLMADSNKWCSWSKGHSLSGSLLIEKHFTEKKNPHLLHDKLVKLLYFTARNKSINGKIDQCCDLINFFFLINTVLEKFLKVTVQLAL